MKNYIITFSSGEVYKINASSKERAILTARELVPDYGITGISIEGEW